MNNERVLWKLMGNTETQEARACWPIVANFRLKHRCNSKAHLHFIVWMQIKANLTYQTNIENQIVFLFLFAQPVD